MFTRHAGRCSLCLLFVLQGQKQSWWFLDLRCGKRPNTSSSLLFGCFWTEADKFQCFSVKKFVLAQMETTEQHFPNLKKAIILQGEIIGSGQLPLQLAKVHRFAQGHFGRGRGFEASGWWSDTEQEDQGFREEGRSISRSGSVSHLRNKTTHD